MSFVDAPKSMASVPPSRVKAPVLLAVATVLPEPRERVLPAPRVKVSAVSRVAPLAITNELEATEAPAARIRVPLETVVAPE